MASPGADTVAVSGISGRFPTEESLEIFHQSIFTYKDTADGACKAADQDSLDAEFFKLTDDGNDPVLLTICKVAYEAFVDAGFGLETVHDSNTALYFEFLQAEDETAKSDHSEATLVDKVATVFSLQGPKEIFQSNSYLGIKAFDTAVKNICKGLFESALVFAIYGNFDHCNQNPCNNDGGSDKNARIPLCAVFLQKSEKCKRIHSLVVHTATKLSCLKDHFMEIQGSILPPRDISYLEIHEGETTTDISSLEEVLTQHLERSLPANHISNKKTELTHNAGLSDILRITVWMKEGKLWPITNKGKSASNDHKKINSGSQVNYLSESELWHGGLITIYYTDPAEGKSNIILKCGSKDDALKTSKEEDARKEQASGQPGILMYGATSEHGLKTFLQDASAYADDLGFQSLLQKSSWIPMPYRGYTFTNVTDIDNTIHTMPCKPQSKRPIWFVYPGLGCAWFGMAKDMMKFDMFKKIIIKCSEITEKFASQNMYDNILNGDEKIWNDIQYTSIATVAVQIALTDMLFAMGIQPDGIIGHSLGENPCAYADGCVTAEDLMISTCHMVNMAAKTKKPKTKLAAVALPWEECKALCPEGVYPACNNAADSVTVVGKMSAVNKFMAQMKAKGVKTTTVGMSISPHCPLAAEIAEETGYIEDLKARLPRKPRTTRWLSTTYPEERWGEEEAQCFGPEYVLHNYIYPVLFHEAAQKIPQNAIIIEIGPHCLFRNILKRTVGPDITYVTLMEKDEKDTEIFMSALGTLYANDVKFDPLKLYQDTDFSTRCSTPLVSPLINKTWSSS